MSQPTKHTPSNDNPWGDESGIHSVAEGGDAPVTLTASDVESLVRLTCAESASDINGALAAAHRQLGERAVTLRPLLTQLAIRAHALQRMQQLATIDELTGLSNRRAFRDLAARAIARCERTRTPVAMLMLDLDSLKAINDRSGHPTGDRAIVTLAQCCVDAIRTSDTAARLGGDEFVVLLPDTDLTAARVIAQRIERSVSAVVIGAQSLSVSIGVSVTDTYIRSVDDLIASADAALYRTKRDRHVAQK